MGNKVKAILKWAGGKSSLSSMISQYFLTKKNMDRYIEPFFGGGSLFFYIANNNKDFLKDSVINDVNKDLMGLYRDIKRSPKKLIEEHEKLIKIFQSKEYSEGYYSVRERFNGLNKEAKTINKYLGIERSAALMLLNKTCFNGLYRVNSKGLFNVPKGSYKKPSYVIPELIYAVNKVLPKINNIKSIPYSKIVYKKNDLIYFDPPYDPINETSSFTSYSGKFGKDEQRELCDKFNELDEMGANVILSNNNTNFIKDLYKGHTFKNVECVRSISSKKDTRGKIQELVIIGKNFGK